MIVSVVYDFTRKNLKDKNL